MTFDDLLDDLRTRIDDDTLVGTILYAADRRGLVLDPDGLDSKARAVLAHHLTVIAGDPEHAMLLAGYLQEGGLRCFLSMASSQWCDDLAPGGPHANLAPDWLAA